MENKDKPAFGFTDNRSSSYEDNEVHYGLTKREYFAAMAMQGILANAEFLRMNPDADIHKLAVINADYLLAELENKRFTNPNEGDDDGFNG